MQLSFFFHAYEILMVRALVHVAERTTHPAMNGIDIDVLLMDCLQVNEFDGYTEVQFNPSHSSLGTKSALISGKTWLANLGMNVFASPNLLLRDVLILGTACIFFWVGGYFSFRVQQYVR